MRIALKLYRLLLLEVLSHKGLLNGELGERDELNEREVEEILLNSPFSPLVLKGQDPLNEGREIKLLEGTLRNRVLSKSSRKSELFSSALSSLPSQHSRELLGAFYTPLPLTDYLADKSISLFLLDGLEELKASSVEEMKRAIKGKTEHLELIKERLERIKVVDPALGDGRFLESAMKKLLKAHELLLQEEGVRADDEVSFKLKLRILSENLYGVDLNPLSVQVARLKLILKLLEDTPSEVLLRNLDLVNSLPSLLESKIKVGNSLIDHIPPFVRESSYHEVLDLLFPFNWEREFPEVFSSGPQPGFQVILSNPPFKKVKNMPIPKAQKELLSRAYKELYGELRGNVDFYKLFLVRFLQLSSPGGVLGVIIPFSFWGDMNSFQVRKAYWELDLKEIIHFSLEASKIMFGANYEVSALILKNTPRRGEGEEAVRLFLEVSHSLKELQGKPIHLSRSLVKSSYLLRLPMIRDEEEIEMMEHLNRFKRFGNYLNGKPLGEILVGKLDETMGKSHISEEPTGELLISNVHVKDWFVDLSTRTRKKRWVRDAELLREKRLRREVMGAKTLGELLRISPKLIGRQMANRGEKRKLHFTVLYGNYMLTNGVRIIILQPTFHREEAYLFLLGLLNSSTLNWFFKKYSTTFNVKPYELKELPLPDMSSALRGSHPLTILVKYALILASLKHLEIGNQERVKALLQFFQEIIDLLSFECYFKERLGTHLSEALKEELEDVRLGEDAAKIPPEKLLEYLQVIEEVHNKLIRNPRVRAYVKVLRENKWFEATLR